MNRRTLLFTCLLLAVLLGGLRCNNDQPIIDRHERALLEEGD